MRGTDATISETSTPYHACARGTEGRCVTGQLLGDLEGGEYTVSEARLRLGSRWRV